MTFLAVAVASLFFLVSLMIYRVSERKKAAAALAVRRVAQSREVRRATAADALYQALKQAFGKQFDVLCDVHQGEPELDADPKLTQTGSLTRHLFALADKASGDIRLVVCFGPVKKQGRIARAAKGQHVVVAKLPLRDKYDAKQVKRDILLQVKERDIFGEVKRPAKVSAAQSDAQRDLPKAVIEVPNHPAVLN